MAAFCIVLAACGGGGGSDQATSTQNDANTNNTTGPSGTDKTGTSTSDEDASNPSPGSTDGGTPPSDDAGDSGSGSDGSSANDGSDGRPAPGPLADIRLTNPRDIAADAKGNLYVIDGADHRNRLRKIAPDGSIATLVPEAEQTITALAVTPSGDVFYSTSDSPTSGVGLIWRLVDGVPVPLTSEKMAISELVIDPSDGSLYVGKWTPNGPEVKLVRQDGSVASLFTLAEPSGAPVAMKMHNGVLWLGWRDGPYPWKFYRWTKESGVKEIPLAIEFSSGMAATESGVYITSYRTNKFTGTSSCSVELLNPDTLELTRIAGQETGGCIFGTGYVSNMAEGSDGNLYLTEYFNHTIRKITPAGEVSLYAGAAGEPGS